MINEYYILATAQLNILEHPEITQTSETVRYNLAKTKFVCKTNVGISDAPFMKSNAKFTHEEILAELSKPTWTNNDI